MFKLTLLFIFLSGSMQAEQPSVFDSLEECEQVGRELQDMNPYLKNYQIVDVRFLCDEVKND